MALIECPECKKEISDKATSCPNCGYPISQQNTLKSYTVILNDCGLDKVKVIKRIREINSMDLLPAKRIADSVPTIFSYDIARNKAEEIKNQLEEVGANVTIREYKSDDPIIQKTNSEQIRCPRCGSTQITTAQKGFSFLTGFIGANKTVNRCAKCGHSWQPK